MSHARPGRSQGLDIGRWIADQGLIVEGPREWRGGRKWIFPVCPFDNNHTNRSAYIVQFSTGAIAAGCHHASCSGKGWHDLRDLVEPGWRERRCNPLDGLIPANASPAIRREFQRRLRRRP